MKSTITNILTKLFPHKEPTLRLSPFIETTWLEKNMQVTQILDYLWTPSKEQ